MGLGDGLQHAASLSPERQASNNSFRLRGKIISLAAEKFVKSDGN
jgi:hypothetical protein